MIKANEMKMVLFKKFHHKRKGNILGWNEAHEHIYRYHKDSINCNSVIFLLIFSRTQDKNQLLIAKSG